jgi:uncharacterized caspase-like protein
VALLFYAGHGVQMEGENYLLPIDNAGISDPGSLRRRAIAAREYVQGMAQAGSRLNIVVLDACRDNPLPQATRGATRGLAVIEAPRDTETVIVFAARAGELAEDGRGRNSTFTKAFLSELEKPDVGLAELFNRVGASVRDTTAGRQVPTMYSEPLSRPFVFTSSEQLAAKAEAAADKAQAELAELERQLADLKAKISTTKDKAARQALEVEQQRQLALQEAKKLEAANLAREALRQRETAAIARQAELEKQAAYRAAEQQQDELANLVAARRAELERLAQAGASNDPDVLIETVERLEAVLQDVDDQYAIALQKSLSALNASFGQQLAALTDKEPDITETDAEFTARITREKQALTSAHENDRSRMMADAEALRNSQTASMRRQLDNTLTALKNTTWTITGSAVALEVGEFDRNERTWPFTVESRDPVVPMLPVVLVAQLNTAPDPAAAIRELDTAVKAEALAAEVDWGITRVPSRQCYGLDIRSVRVRNLATNSVVVERRLERRSAHFTAGKRTQSMAPNWGELVLTCKGSAAKLAEVKVEGEGLEQPLRVTVPGELPLYTGTYAVTAVWDSGETRTESLQISESKAARLNLIKPYTTETALFLRGNGTVGVTPLSLGFGIEGIIQYTSPFRILNPLFAQLDIYLVYIEDIAGETSSESATLPGLEVSAAIGGWLFGRADSRPILTGYAIGFVENKRSGIALAIGGGVSVITEDFGDYTLCAKLASVIVITLGGVGLEVQLDAFVPVMTTEPDYLLRINVPIFGFGKTVRSKEH